MIACTGTLGPKQRVWLAARIPAWRDLCRAGAEFRARAAEVAIARANDQEIAERKRSASVQASFVPAATVLPMARARR